MRRRTLLSTLTASSIVLAGCETADSGSDPTATDPRGTVSGCPETTEPMTPKWSQTPDPDWPDLAFPETDRPDPEREVSIAEFESTPRTCVLRPTSWWTWDNVEVAIWFEQTATADHPATVRGWLRNANDFERRIKLGRLPAVGQPHSSVLSSSEEGVRLHLAPTMANELAETVPEIRQHQDGRWYAVGTGSWMPETYALSPDEHVELAYHLAEEPGLSARPSGTYRFPGQNHTVTLTLWERDHPGPATDSRLVDRSVPTSDRLKDVGWFHQADDNTAVYVRPSTERLELDGRIDFEVINHSYQTLRGGHWNLFELDDRGWTHIGPETHTLELRTLYPGEHNRWTIRAFTDAGSPCERPISASRVFTKGNLSAGTYAAVAGYGRSHNKSGALFEVVDQS